MSFSDDPFVPQPDEAGLTGSLQGRFLIAMPSMEDSRFARTVIYMCSHSAEGAMGLVINKPSDQITFVDLVEQLSIETEARTIPSIPILAGGPVDGGRGFVLHSPEYDGANSTIQVGNGVRLTATTDVIRAIADGDGPHDKLVALGYAGWEAGQLEAEIKANGWLVSDAEPDIIFAPDIESKWTQALATLGVDPSLLSGETGHA
ncbi:MAG: YqgE/AlgH family protein [Alphaproteobacteria bacterium]|nr:YqgE/AlgH family protein [Alphaproteobacteria bacterium]